MPRRTPDPLDVAAGCKLRAARVAANLSQTQLGQAIGVTFQQIQKYERGTNRISVSALIGMAEALDVPPAALLPRVMAEGKAAPDPLAALGASIGGLELAQTYARLSSEQQRSVLSIAKAIVQASSIKAAAA